MLLLSDPVVVIGDIHGQFFDLLKILSHNNLVNLDRNPAQKIIMMGDYVDRGINSVEVITLLMVLKVTYPEQLFLLRGNHESRIMTESYNFMTECLSKYSQSVYEGIMDVFDTLPLSALVNSRHLVVHGGISDKITKIDEINEINRVKEIPVENSAFCDLMWSDPTDHDHGRLARGKTTTFNYSRDCSIVFGRRLLE